MKTVKLEITMIVTDEYYNENIKELKKEIANGKHQREMMSARAKKNGLKGYKAFIKNV